MEAEFGGTCAPLNEDIYGIDVKTEPLERCRGNITLFYGISKETILIIYCGSVSAFLNCI